MPPMDSAASFYEGSWLLGNNCPDLFDVKCEGGIFSNLLLNSMSSAESCMSKVEQVVYQRAAHLPSAPHLSSLGDVSIVSDSLMQVGLDHVKPVERAFSSFTSAQGVGPCSNSLVSSLPVETGRSEPARFPQKDGWSATVSGEQQHFTTRDSFESLGGGCLAKSGFIGGASAAIDSTNDLKKQVTQMVGRNNAKPLSDETSLDDILTTSSGVSSTSGYLPRDHEDDDGICTTSAEPSSQMGRSPPLGAIGALALARQDEQQRQLSSSTSISPTPDQRELGSPTSVSPRVHQNHESTPSNGSGTFQMSDGVAIPSVVPLDIKPTHVELGAIVDDGTWCKKEMNERMGSGVFPSGQILNQSNAVTAPVVASSILQRSTSSNICHSQNDTCNLAGLNPTLNPVVADKSVVTYGESMVRGTIMADHLAQAMLFRTPFSAINMAEVESSRPKRRNVKISKDPQSVAARHRRERISDRIRILQRLVPGGTKMDTASMLDEAISYVKYLKAQVQTLETVSTGTGSFDPRLSFGPGSFYRTSIAGLPYSPMVMDCSSVAHETGSDQNDFKDLREGFLPLCDGNYPVQFCH